MEDDNEISPSLPSLNDTNSHEMKNDKFISATSQHDNEHEQQRKYNHIRLGLYVFSVCYTTLFAGAFFGWGPMQLLLEQDGAFSFVCKGITAIDNDFNETTTNNNDIDGTIQTTTNKEDEICPEQTQRLLNVHFVAALAMMLTPLFGHIVDKSKGGSKGRGPITLMKVVAMLECVGIGLLLISRSIHWDWLLYISFFSIASSTNGTIVLIISTAMALFDDDKGQRRVISSLNMFFDAGSITYLFLWYIHEATTQTNEESTIYLIVLGYLIIAILCFGGALIFWNKLLQMKEENKSECTTKIDDSCSVHSLSFTKDKNCEAEEAIQNDTGIENSNDRNNDCANLDVIGGHLMTNEDELLRSRCDNYDVLKYDDKIKCGEESIPHQQHGTNSSTITNAKTISGYTLVKLRSPRGQLLSGHFVFLVIYFCLHVCRNNFTLTTARDYMSYLGDDDHRYLTIFSLILPASILGFPLVDIVLNSFGYHAGFQLVNVLALIHGGIQVLSSYMSLKIQIFGFVVFSFYRSFLFSVVFSFLAAVMSQDIVGKANGILLVIAGVTTFLNIPLGNVAIRRNGNFWLPNLIYTILVLSIGCISAYVLGQKMSHEEKEKDDQQNQNNVPMTPNDEIQESNLPTK